LRSVLVNARRGIEAPRLYRIDLDHPGPPQPLGPVGIRIPSEIQVIDIQSPDDKRVLVVDTAEATYRVLQLADGTVRPIPAFRDQWNAGWHTSSSLAVWINYGGKRTELYDHDITSGRRTLLRTFTPLDDTGDATTGITWISRDLTRYVKFELQRHGFLYVVDGVR
jgi:hypothetical protein